MKFNLRVYGIVINDNNEVLIADEERKGVQFTKFPGGGLEFGEGTIDCLKREFIEELNQDIVELEHYYTTDFYIGSAFNEQEQLISIYYKVKLEDLSMLTISENKFDFKVVSEEMISLRWLSLQSLSQNDVTFQIDKKVIEMLMNEVEKN
jgi:8-oxo-dGTP diphosphatase